jgi:hypothetical protein
MNACVLFLALSSVNGALCTLVAPIACSALLIRVCTTRVVTRQASQEKQEKQQMQGRGHNQRKLVKYVSPPAQAAPPPIRVCTSAEELHIDENVSCGDERLNDHHLGVGEVLQGC